MSLPNNLLLETGDDLLKEDGGLLVLEHSPGAFGSGTPTASLSITGEPSATKSVTGTPTATKSVTGEPTST